MNMGLLTPGLVMIDPDIDRMAAQTVAGMAHWAGSGPPDTTCGMCIHRVVRPGTWRCEKFKKLTGKWGAPIGADLKSCKYFERNPHLVKA
jgi:hypothetical protein